MSVKNYIAAFEAHNDVVRASPASSPGRSQASETAISPGDMASFSSDLPRRDSDRGSVASDHSATGLASHARRSRLQKELDKPVSPQSSEVSRGSLAERRKSRQQRKQYLMQKRSSNNGHSEKRESRHTPPTSPPARYMHRQQPESQASNRRLANAPSVESDGPDAGSRATGIYRTARGDYDYDYTQYDNVDGTDDEATLTSVRQIMTTTMIQPPFLREGMKPHNVLRTASSSSFEVDTRRDMYNDVTKSTSLQHPQHADDDDDDAMEYTSLNEQDDDEEDDISSTYEFRKKKEREIRTVSKSNAKKTRISAPLVNKADVEHLRKTLDTPVAKTAAFVVGAATVGTLLFGPVGLLLGAATVGIGVGIMQIPEEQRTHMKDKATKTLHQAHDSVLNASEALSASCAASCHASGVGQQFPAEMKQCFTHDDVQTNDDHHSVSHSTIVQLDRGADGSFSVGNGGFTAEGNSHVSPAVASRNRRVACLRDGKCCRCQCFHLATSSNFQCCTVVRITPVDQIHGLPPQKQPRAWLDVLASANTTSDEKSEAMEEVKILSRDKRHARMLLDEGILDSLMYILNRFFDKARRGTPQDAQERFQAKLAASCCVTLGKAHCAAVHTEGDLLLMSMYERGTVPEERQLAQMLYEVPHHVLSKEPNVFALQHMSMSKAEELACSIKDLATSS